MSAGGSSQRALTTSIQSSPSSASEPAPPPRSSSTGRAACISSATRAPPSSARSGTNRPTTSPPSFDPPRPPSFDAPGDPYRTPESCNSVARWRAGSAKANTSPSSSRSASPSSPSTRSIADCARLCMSVRSPIALRSTSYVSSNDSRTRPRSTAASFQPRLTASVMPTLSAEPPAGNRWAASPARNTRPARYRSASRPCATVLDIQMGSPSGTSTPSTSRTAARKSARLTSSSVCPPGARTPAMSTPSCSEVSSTRPFGRRFQPGSSPSPSSDSKTLMSALKWPNSSPSVSVVPGKPIPARSRTTLRAPSQPTTYRALIGPSPVPSVTPSSSWARSRTSQPLLISTPSSRARSASSRSSRGCWISSSRSGMSSIPSNRSGTAPNGNPGARPENGLPALKRSSSPLWSSNSTICPPSPLALGSSLASALFSSTIGRAPARLSSHASISPTGPAPTISTSSMPVRLD